MADQNKLFFCGCSPRDSTFALGIILTIGSLLGFGVALKTTIRAFHSETIAKFFEVQLYIYGENSSLVLVFRFLTLLAVLLSVMMVAANVLLVAGVIKEKPVYIKRWKISYLAVTGVATVVAGVTAVLCFMSQCSDTIGSFFIIVGFVHACLVLYVVSIVNIHHMILEDNFKKFTNRDQFQYSTES